MLREQGTGENFKQPRILREADDSLSPKSGVPTAASPLMPFCGVPAESEREADFVKQVSTEEAENSGKVFIEDLNVATTSCLP